MKKSKNTARQPANGTTRRTFLKAAGAGATLAGMTSAGLAPMIFVRNAVAADKQLKIIQWSHFVPSYDKWLDNFVKEWGEKNGVKATIDHIPHLEIPARSAAEVSAQAGHDLFGFNNSGGPHLYRNHAENLNSLVAEMEKKYGAVGQVGHSFAYDGEVKAWTGFPDYYISFPGLYRIDLWGEIGMKPDTWEDIRIGGAKLKAKGYPVGIGLGHSNDPNLSYNSLMWSFGAHQQDKDGKKVTLNSKETLEATKYVAALYKEAMTPEVLSWDDASNNRFLASGKGSWIHNPISAYRSIQTSNPELADKIGVWKTPAGPVRRLACAAPNSMVLWKFSKNKDAAMEFLRHYALNWKDGFVASQGYNHPVMTNILPKPMPILANDPTSHPANKLEVLQTTNDWHGTYGYPGPGGAAIDEVVQNFIIPDMMANAATDKMSPQDAVKWAVAEVDKIFAKWIAKA